MKIAMTVVLAFVACSVLADENETPQQSTLEFRLAASQQTDGYTQHTDTSTQEVVYLAAESVVTGDDIKSVSFYNDDTGHPIVGFVLTDDGSKRFWKATSENIGRKLAIVLDGKVVSAPKVVSGIRKEGSISGRFDANDLQRFFSAIVLRKLPSGSTLTPADNQ